MYHIMLLSVFIFIDICYIILSMYLFPYNGALQAFAVRIFMYFQYFFEFLAAMFCHSRVQLPVKIADPRHLDRFDLSILQQVGD